MQSIIDKSDFTNFLQSGAVLQLSSDQFKLIWGPFHQTEFDFKNLSDEETAIYKPHFWDFSNAKSPGISAFFGQKEAILTRSQLLKFCEDSKPLLAQVDWSETHEADFTEQFQWSHRKFQSQELLKTVPIICQTGQVEFTSHHLAESLRHLVLGNHYGTTYGFWEQGEGYLGHSPEIIVEWYASDKTLRSMALAGTSGPGQTAFIINDKKTLREHQIVVEDIVFTFNKVSPLAVQVRPIQILGLKHLNHLLTPIEVDGVTQELVEKYLVKIHPTAALGIYPRHPDLCHEFCEFDIQKKRREFAAPFGFLNKSRIKVTAAIRNFSFTKNQIEIFSGCGVTSDSQVESELKELETKRNSVKKMMGLNL